MSSNLRDSVIEEEITSQDALENKDDSVLDQDPEAVDQSSSGVRRDPSPMLTVTESADLDSQHAKEKHKADDVHAFAEDDHTIELGDG